MKCKSCKFKLGSKKAPWTIVYPSQRECDICHKIRIRELNRKNNMGAKKPTPPSNNVKSGDQPTSPPPPPKKCCGKCGCNK